MMFDDPVPDGHRLEADIVIIGGGVAGIAIATALAGTQRTVLLIESGGLGKDKSAEALNQGESSRPDIHAPPNLFRARTFGGASSIWGGRCVPYDALDFEERPWLPVPGWPIGYAEVQSRLPAAMRFLEAGDADFEERSLAAQTAWIDGFTDEDVRVSLERFSPPTHVGRRHKAALARADNIRVAVQSTCVELLVDPSGGRIAEAVFRNRDGGQFTAAAPTFILASGGLENARLLLASRRTIGSGLGNGNDLVGRYYMCHIEATISDLVLEPAKRPVCWDFERTRDGVYARRRLQLSPQTQRRERLLNAVARLHYPYVADPIHRHGILSLMYMAKSGLIPEFNRKLAMVDLARNATMRRDVRHYGAHLGNLLRDAPGLARFVGGWIVRRHLRYRRIPHVTLPSVTGHYPLDFNGEQSPNPESRIMLSGEVDRYGMPRLRIDWRMAELDIRSAIGTIDHWRNSLERSGVGTISATGDALAETIRNAVPVGGHHIGTTRMATSPRHGVVDPDCRVHGIDNLYVAGASIFPTSSHANPTLTVVAMALRLADHLGQAA